MHCRLIFYLLQLFALSSLVIAAHYCSLLMLPTDVLVPLVFVHSEKNLDVKFSREWKYMRQVRCSMCTYI